MRPEVVAQALATKLITPDELAYFLDDDGDPSLSPEERLEAARRRQSNHVKPPTMTRHDKAGLLRLQSTCRGPLPGWLEPPILPPPRTKEPTR